MKRRRALAPLKKPSQDRSRHTVEAILQAATYILVRSEYEGFTTNAIARRAGVNIATLYQYFPNKESIFAELNRRHVEKARAAIAKAMTASRGGGLEGVVRASVDATIAEHRIDPVLHRILTEEGQRLGIEDVEIADDALLAGRQTSRKVLEKTVPDPELALWIVETALHALVHAAAAERPHELTRSLFAEELARLVTGYLGGRGSP